MLTSWIKISSVSIRTLFGSFLVYYHDYRYCHGKILDLCQQVCPWRWWASCWGNLSTSTLSGSSMSSPCLSQVKNSSTKSWTFLCGGWFYWSTGWGILSLFLLPIRTGTYVYVFFFTCYNNPMFLYITTVFWIWFALPDGSTTSISLLSMGGS